jgi:hypothetical protein
VALPHVLISLGYGTVFYLQDLKCPSVSLPPSQIQILENVSSKLHNRHPAASRDLDHANYHYIAALDSTLPDPPSITSRVETLGVRLASLMGENQSQYMIASYCSGGLDLEKGVNRSPYVMCNLGNGDGVALPRFVANRDLALELLVTQPLHSRKFRTDSPLSLDDKKSH